MHVLLKLSIDFLTVIIGMLKLGGIKAVVAENLILKQQLLLLNRSRKRSPNLPNLQRFIFGALGQLIRQSRFSRVSVVFRPSTLIEIHRHFTKRKYRQLFASKPKKKPGPKGPDPKIVKIVIEFKQWKANLRILEIEPIRTIPYVPVSHPFIERLIGTIRREYLDHFLFWNSRDLQKKLNSFKIYYNEEHVHLGINGELPNDKSADQKSPPLNISNFFWKSHCNGLFKTPKAA